MVKNSWLLIWAFGLSLLLVQQVQAFPDMIRHGYVNCNSCHVSPTGGRMLTGYGRVMSNELLSAWGSEREVEFLHGLLPEESMESWLMGGGNVRVLQVHRETPDRKVGRGFLMQASLDLAARWKAFTAYVSVGEPDQETRSIKPLAQSYYLMWQPLPELALRGGHFLPVFGLHVPYHTLPTRQGLEFAPGQERNVLESIWSGQDWSLGLSASQSSLEASNPAEQEQLLTARVNRSFANTHQVGMSALVGSSDERDRQALSLHGVFGFSEKLAFQAEAALQGATTAGSESTQGIYHFGQLHYEWRKGVGFYLLEDYQKTNLSDDRSLTYSHGVGARLFPRPHFEVDLLYSKRRAVAASDRYDDFAWAMFHYYF